MLSLMQRSQGWKPARLGQAEPLEPGVAVAAGAFGLAVDAAFGYLGYLTVTRESGFANVLGWGVLGITAMWTLADLGLLAWGLGNLGSGEWDPMRPPGYGEA